VNFIDPAFVLLLCCIYQECNIQGTVTPAEIQGLEANRKHWAQSTMAEATTFELTAGTNVASLGFRPAGLPPERVIIQVIEDGSWAAVNGILAGDELVTVKDKPVFEMLQSELIALKHERPLKLSFRREEVMVEPVVVLHPVPSQWAVNAVNSMLAPQLNEQCRKTKLCIFNAQNRCEMGMACPFAHSQAELQPMPDLAKTKLCHNFFRGRCTAKRCRFAHGSDELRSEWIPYSPGAIFLGGGGIAAGAAASGFGCFGCGTDEDPQQFGRMPTPDESMMGFGMAEAYPAGLWGEVSMEPMQKAAGSEEECSLWQPTRPRSKRRASSVGRLDFCSEGVMLREFGTFMEAVELTGTDADELGNKRSWSDGDLPAFKEALEASDPG